MPPFRQSSSGGRGHRPSKFAKPRRVSEYQDRVLEVRRVTRVMAGGKRFSFRAAVVLGNRNGKVGFGIAKGLDVAGAVEKAKRQAEKEIVAIPLKEGRTIAFDVEAKYAAARIRIKPAPRGHGLIAGGATRAVLDLLGVKDVTAKNIGTTKSKTSNARATIEALKKVRDVVQRKEKQASLPAAQAEEITVSIDAV